MDGERRPESDDPIAVGDAAAAAGRWPQAVAAWGDALATPRRAEAVARLRWFVAWRSDRPLATTPGGDAPPATRPVLLAAAASGIAATAFVLVAVEASEIARAVLAVGAWLFYTAAAVLSLVYAARSGRQQRGREARLSRRAAARLVAEATALVTGDPPVTAPAMVEPGLREGSSI